jgi:regulatory protein
MAIITSIKQQKNKNRVNVYLDNKFGFGIDLDNFVLLGLKVDQELTDEEIEKVIKKAEFQKTYDKLLRFAMTRPRSEKEVFDWFRRKEVHESLHNDLLKKLKSLNLLNDLEFAKWWVDQRIQFKSKSKRVIQIELRQKGIKKEIIDEVLEEVPIDEEKLAKELIAKKMYKWEKLEPRLKKQKMSQYLAGKGFSWGIIEKALDFTKNEEGI